MTTVEGYKLGKLLIEGKTKQVYELPSHPGHCLILSKDRITAGDGARAHDLAGKAEISNTTNGLIFQILNAAGLNTAYVKPAGPKAFIAKNCTMVPIEWVTRRLATGSFLKRNPGVPEGYRFSPPKQETFFKDDANHDPQWSDEQIISAKFNFNGLLIGQDEVDIMKKTTVLVFEILERAWATKNCALIDMKIEFGVDQQGNIVLADIIDSDSWRLWPAGDKRLMVDKDVYRKLVTVTDESLDTVKRNYIWTSEQLKDIVPKNDHLVVILMGSASDKAHCEKIADYCKTFGLNTELRVTSAHKAPEETLRVMREYESVMSNLVFIAVAGRSNGLGPVLSGSTTYPVINCPPVKAENMQVDVWSSLNVPSGLGCPTVMYPEAAALHAAQILGLHNYMIWAKLRTKQMHNFITLKKGDQEVRGVRNA
ncbi:bifunctional phosphoribosylaminoimidazole carboxylase/phosphoribosylaminoimidazole succinocarboxamide synthetase [Stomoxys calcitrans]|uniref:PurE domain-containing protein n=1 Tax=Stomoxys calcitrans TaxID=35570 RepID=A0A1I8PRB4_STOCA|nr:bifunctional phosphoribosylaminoimidazole carboxylase/phosphoribosylaminoimidazole succinocarboxamide synthetase [Stomoxys calcitrans]